VSVLQDAVNIESAVEVCVSDNSGDDATAAAFESVTNGRQDLSQARYFRNNPPVDAVANFNRCIELAAGRWILILHDDDYLLSGGLKAILRAVSEAAAHEQVLLFGVDVVHEDGRRWRRQTFGRRRYLTPTKALLRVLSNSSFVRFPAIVVRKDAYAEAGLFQPIGGPTDVEMWTRLFSRFGVVCVPATTCAYVLHAAAATERAFTGETIAILSKVFESARTTGLLDESTLRRCRTDFFHQFILAGAFRRLRRGDRKGAGNMLALFDTPQLHRLPGSPRWAAVRFAMRALTYGAQDETWHVTGTQ
jgi:glycosyltransferase involved in cell wall biosynthesis